MMQTATSDVLRLQEIIEAQKKVIVSQREKLQWYEGILSNKKLQGSTRLATIAAKRLADTAQPGEDGYYKVYLPKLADMVGVSPSAMSRGLRTLADCTDALEHRTEAKKDEPYKDVVFIRPTDLLNHPELIEPTKEIKRHGGSRKCECGGDLLVKERVLTSQQYTVCTGCGEQHIFPARIVNEALEVSDPLHDATAIVADMPVEEIGDPSRCKMQPILLHTSVSVQFDSIPAELRCKMQWACHRAKVPYDAKITTPMRMRDMLASSTDETTWATYEQAVSTWQASQKWALPYDGIGFMVTSGYILADFDHCITEEGHINALASQRIAWLHTYSEISYSGTGVHCIAYATLPRSIKQSEIELYGHARFVVMTGKQLTGTPSAIEDRQEQVSALFTEIAPPVVERQPRAEHVYASCGLTDEQVLMKCRNGQNSTRFNKLWEGDASDYLHADGTIDPSRADAALCEELMYRSDRDRAMVDRLYRQSGLYREKWEREDYRNWTLDLAMGVRKAS